MNIIETHMNLHESCSAPLEPTTNINQSEGIIVIDKVVFENDAPSIALMRVDLVTAAAAEGIIPHTTILRRQGLHDDL